MQRSTSCWISARSSSSLRMVGHGDFYHILAIGQTAPVTEAEGEGWRRPYVYVLVERVGLFIWVLDVSEEV
jgi:hypothetical protein